MALSAYVKKITVPASTGSQAYTGVGFQPKVIIVYGGGVTADGYVVNAQNVFGVGVSSSSRACISWTETDAVSSKGGAKATYAHTDAAPLRLTPIATTHEADLTSLDADGFTLNWSTVGATKHDFYVLCLGGSEITNVALKKVTLNTSTGSQAVTGVGFQPDFILAFTARNATTPPDNLATGDAFHGIGYWTSSAQGSIGLNDRSYQTGDSKEHSGSQSSVSKVIAIPTCSATGSLSTGLEIQKTSFDSDGFTFNITATPGGAYFAWFLCLKGTFQVGTFDEAFPTSTSPDQTVTTSFLPSCIFAIGHGGTSHAQRNGINLTLSAHSSTSNGYGWGATARDAAAGVTDCAMGAKSAQHIWSTYGGAADIEGNISAIGSGSFTMHPTTVNDAKKYHGFYLGDAAASGPTYRRGARLMMGLLCNG